MQPYPYKPCSPSSSSDAIDFITSQRGGRIMIRAGYSYRVKRKNKDDTILWRCVESKCYAVVKTINETSSVIISETPHNHEANYATLLVHTWHTEDPVGSVPPGRGSVGEEIKVRISIYAPIYYYKYMEQIQSSDG